MTAYSGKISLSYLFLAGLLALSYTARPFLLLLACLPGRCALTCDLVKILHPRPAPIFYSILSVILRRWAAYNSSSWVYIGSFEILQKPRGLTHSEVFCRCF